MKRINRLLGGIVLIVLLTAALAVPAYADTDVAGVVVNTWTATRAQAVTIVNNVLFPAIDFILGIWFFVSATMSGIKYKKQGQLDITMPCILFVCLIIALTAPLYIWQII